MMQTTEWQDRPPVDLSAAHELPRAAERWVVCYGPRLDQDSYHKDRSAAELAAVRLHGVVVRMAAPRRGASRSCR